MIDEAKTAVAPRQPRPEVFLSPQVRQWITENRLRRRSPEAIIATMVGRGIHPQAAVAAVQSVDQDPCYQAALKICQLHQLALNLDEVIRSGIPNLHTLASNLVSTMCLFCHWPGGTKSRRWT
jgi:hypothetical protein